MTNLQKLTLAAFSALAVTVGYGQAHAAGQPVSEANSAAILAATGAPSDAAYSGSGSGSSISIAKYFAAQIAAMRAQLPTALNGDGGLVTHVINWPSLQAVTISGSAAFSPYPTGSAQGAIAPVTTITGACNVAKGVTGSAFSFAAYAPGATFVYLVDVAATPAPGTVFNATGGANALLAPPIPVGSTGFVSMTDFFPTYTTSGVAVCVSTNATAGTFTAATGVVFITIKQL